MRKAERLFQILNLLRNRRTVMTALQLSEALEVSERTIYRDIQALVLSGVPVEGEAGVGYRIHKRFDLPPLMFDRDEVEALLLGVRMVRTWSDRQLAASANSALNKITAILPPDLQEVDETFPVRVPQFQYHTLVSAHSEDIRAATKAKRKLQVCYCDANQDETERVLWPLGLFYWGSVWTLVAWCVLRKDYRAFRLDRIQTLEVLDETFSTTSTLSLNHYLELQKKRTVMCKD